MNRVCVATSDSRAYYQIVSRLRKSGLEFLNVVPGGSDEACDVIVTTQEEAPRFGDRALTFESLSDDPGVFKGQLTSWFDRGADVMMIGIDPGARTGLAAFYGETRLALGTFEAIDSLSRKVGEFVRNIPSRRSVVRVGNGNSALAIKIAQAVKEEVPEAAIEFVDEAGTSDRSGRLKGVQGDQSAAAKIAFRKGVTFSEGRSRSQR